MADRAPRAPGGWETPGVARLSCGSAPSAGSPLDHDEPGTSRPATACVWTERSPRAEDPDADDALELWRLPDHSVESPAGESLAVQWKRLAVLVVVVFCVLVVSLLWTRSRGPRPHRSLPAFIPGTLPEKDAR